MSALEEHNQQAVSQTAWRDLYADAVQLILSWVPVEVYVHRDQFATKDTPLMYRFTADSTRTVYCRQSFTLTRGIISGSTNNQARYSVPMSKIILANATYIEVLFGAVNFIAANAHILSRNLRLENCSCIHPSAPDKYLVTVDGYGARLENYPKLERLVLESYDSAHDDYLYDALRRGIKLEFESVGAEMSSEDIVHLTDMIRKYPRSVYINKCYIYADWQKVIMTRARVIHIFDRPTISSDFEPITTEIQADLSCSGDVIYLGKFPRLSILTIHGIFRKCPSVIMELLPGLRKLCVVCTEDFCSEDYVIHRHKWGINKSKFHLTIERKD